MWAQADANVAGIDLGAQYASMDPAAENLEESMAFAVKAAYATDAFTVSAAYSDADEDGVLAIANTATGLSGGAQTKLYTEAWWNFGYVGEAGTSAVTLIGETGVGSYDVGAYFTTASNDETDVDMTELTLTAGSSAGSLDYSFAYVYTEADDQNDGDAFNNIQAYLTYNF